MKNLVFPLAVIIFSLVSCKKDAGLIDSNSNKQPLNQRQEPPKDELLACNCSTANEGGPDEYIRAEVNGVKICADLVAQYGGYPFGNMLKYGKIIRDTGNTYYDNLHMIRRTRDGRREFAIFLENTHALTKQYPYQLPRAQIETCEMGEVQLNNLLDMGSTSCMFCPSNTSHYLNFFAAGHLTLYSDKFENNYFEGRFEGIMMTGSGRGVIIRNGQFRIKLTLLQEDITIPN